MAEPKNYDLVADSLKVLQNNLPSIITMISVKGNIKFRQILAILFLPMLLGVIGKTLEKLRQKRLKYRFSHQIELGNDVNTIEGGNLPSIILVEDELERFFGKDLPIEDRQLINICSQRVNLTRNGSYSSKSCFFAMTFTEEVIKRYKNQYKHLTIIALDAYYDRIKNKTITYIKDNGKAMILGTEMGYLEDFMSIIITTSNVYFQNQKSKSPKYYEVSSKESGDGQDLLFKRNMDKIILNENSQLKERLIKWKSQKQFYNTHDLPYKIGLLFYGTPGSGKTSLSYAIAVHFSYHFYRIHIKDTFDWVFDLLLKNPRSIFLFDEFDLMLERLELLVPPNKKTTTKEGVLIEESLSPVDYKKEFISRLLQTLEDIRLQEVIIIFTTNKEPKDFNPALIRPGRIDYSEFLGNCSRDQFKRIYADYIGTDIPETYVFPENKYSPAHVINQVIVPYHETPNRIFELLV